jgi:hypothetical protein
VVGRKQMKNPVAIKYIVTWTSQEPKRGEVYFYILQHAEFFYNEKLEEDKNPSIFMEETTTTRRKLK